ncbi:hypothetical protein KCP69_25575 [Salmonella enterica subsp. enterica]|nr:hypothetical protein KCP69_25575 [Salmonella enterica subsp. enterica]
MKPRRDAGAVKRNTMDSAQRLLDILGGDILSVWDGGLSGAVAVGSSWIIKRKCWR